MKWWFIIERTRLVEVGVGTLWGEQPLRQEERWRSIINEANLTSEQLKSEGGTECSSKAPEIIISKKNMTIEGW